MSATAVEVEGMTPTALTAQDRCDRCGAQAYARTAHETAESDLLWCAHHFIEHEAVLLPLLVDDQRHKLA